MENVAMWWQRRYYADGFEDGRRCMIQGMHLEKIKNGNKMDYPLEPPEGGSPPDTLTLAQWNWFQSSSLQNCKIGR